MTTFRVYENGTFYYFHMGQIMSPFSQEKYDKICLDGLTFDPFTGLIDKNDDKIFVGDILKMSYDTFDGNFTSKEITAEVIYDKELCCFGMKAFQDNEEYTIPFLNLISDWSNDKEYAEVIGNIYETPELLNS